MFKTISKPLSLWMAAGALLMLAGCVDRATADATLARGCEAGVRALLPEGYEIAEIKGHTVTDSPEGRNYRHVALHAVEMDGWLEVEKDYECIFEESFGFLNMNHTASLYQLRLGEDQVYGKSGNQIMGDARDMIRLNDAIRKAMYE